MKTNTMDEKIMAYEERREKEFQRLINYGIRPTRAKRITDGYEQMPYIAEKNHDNESRKSFLYSKPFKNSFYRDDNLFEEAKQFAIEHNSLVEFYAGTDMWRGKTTGCFVVHYNDSREEY